jgi:dolichyl-phosphate beta-glucosyltransferase
VVVPAWNEAARLPATLEAITAYLSERRESAEVLVVSDGSDDGTEDVVRERGAGSPVRLLRHERRLGKGAAVRTGMLAARGERVLFTDADLPVPPASLEDLDHALDEGADVAIGSRRLPGSVVVQDQGWLRRSMGRAFPWIVRRVTGLPWRDTQCGFKLLRREAARRLFEPLVETGYVFDVEVLLRARDLGLGVVEVAVPWTSRPGSKVRTFRTPVAMLAALLRLRARGT